MKVDLLDELLADLIGDAPMACPAGTAAKAANPANLKDWRGLAADLQRCEGLRKPANCCDTDTLPGGDSQEFATLRKPINSPQGQQIRGSSQDSQDSQGVADPKHSQTCTDCLHLLRRGTCGEPVAAGLLADGFGLVWPPAGHATSCGAFMPKPAPEPPGRPYKLSAAEADRCHAGAWDDGTITRFVARVSLFLRRGVAAEDADDLAERLVLRDRDGDDRRACVECRNLAGHVSTSLRCKAARAAGVAPDLPVALVMQQQRCPAFADGVAR